jgi:DNA-binding response OmpR family regulator
MTSIDRSQSVPGGTRPHRAVLVEGRTASGFSRQLAALGYETAFATPNTALQKIREFSPDVTVIEIPRATSGGEDELFAMARRLRAEPAYYALPLVFVFEVDERATRNAAMNIGVDDYFGLSTPPAEIKARFDSLFWRVAAGRRAASAAGNQRLEIDNFMLMLDSVREDVLAGSAGTVALVYALSTKSDRDREGRDRTLAEAQGFFKLNLRRVDGIAFYGPTTFLIYLPRTKGTAATATFNQLRTEFLRERSGCDLAIGLASFPEDGGDVETLIEKTEAAANAARAGSDARRVAPYRAKEDKAASVQTPPEAPPEAPTALEPEAVSPVLGAEDSAAPAIETVAHAPGATRTVTQPERENGSQPDILTSDAARAAGAAAAARELERRARGAIMPRRLLLTVSNAARMVQINSLIRSAGYEARAAFDGQQALDLLRIERPDLLLLDYELNGINGVEMLRRLRAQSGGTLTLPVILLLPQGNESARAEALKLGARGVLNTPYDPVDLLASVRTAGSGQ